MRKLTAVFDRTIDIMTIFAGILLTFATFSVVVTVALRYLLNIGVGWVLEVAEYVLVYVAFLVAAWVLRKEGHVKMDIVLSFLKPRTQSLLNIITSAVGAALCLALTWYGVKVTWNLFQTDIFTITVMEVPKFTITAIIPVGCFMLFIQFLRNVYNYRKSWMKGITR